MKRLLLAVGLLALVVTACVLSNGCLRRNTAELLAYMEAAQEAYDREDKAACLEQSRRLAEAFPEKTRFFPGRPFARVHARADPRDHGQGRGRDRGVRPRRALHVLFWPVLPVIGHRPPLGQSGTVRSALPTAIQRR